ncbi:hypothetical protein JOM56_010131 [Amanita muscaria]
MPIFKKKEYVVEKEVKTLRPQRGVWIGLQAFEVKNLEKDKNGLMTEGVFDFDIISSKDQKEGRSCYIIPTSFEVTVEGANCKITTMTPVTIQVAFKQKHIGRCEDRLKMVFEDVQLDKRFLISKSLSAKFQLPSLETKLTMKR